MKRLHCRQDKSSHSVLGKMMSCFLTQPPSPTEGSEGHSRTRPTRGRDWWTSQSELSSVQFRLQFSTGVNWAPASCRLQEGRQSPASSRGQVRVAGAREARARLEKVQGRGQGGAASVPGPYQHSQYTHGPLPSRRCPCGTPGLANWAPGGRS